MIAFAYVNLSVAINKKLEKNYVALYLKSLDFDKI